MTLHSLCKRLEKLESRLPTPRVQLGHISLSNLERLEEHFLAAYALPQFREEGRLLIGVRTLLETYDGQPRRLSPAAIRRICKPPPNSTFHMARVMNEVKADALAVLPARSLKAAKSYLTPRPKAQIGRGRWAAE